MRALQTKGYTVIAIAPEDIYSARIRAAGIACEAVPISGRSMNPLTEAISVIRLWRVLGRLHIDLVLSYTPKGNLYSGLASIARAVSFVPNVSGLGRAFTRKSFGTFAARALYKLTFWRARKVFFQNMDDMAVFIDKGLVRATQSERLPGSGVDLTRFRPAQPVHRELGCVVFLLVARMLWDKGVGEYVEAGRKVRLVYPKVRFQLLGFLDVANPSAISRQQMDDWVAEGVVEYLGQTDDVRPLLLQADCVVLPSCYREGVPRSLLEAAASARPLITTDAPGCRDTVVDGESGYLCRPGDAADLADKMFRFIDLAPQTRKAMGQVSRSHAERHFDERLVISRYLTLVRSIGPCK